MNGSDEGNLILKSHFSSMLPKEDLGKQRMLLPMRSFCVLVSFCLFFVVLLEAFCKAICPLLSRSQSKLPKLLHKAQCCAKLNNCQDQLSTAAVLLSDHCLFVSVCWR